MELFFNELSLEGKESISQETGWNLAKVYRALQKYGITTCRIDSENNHKLHQMIGCLPNSMNLRNFYFSFFRSPYESETVEAEADEYLGYDWLFDGKPCIGFALAFILNSAGVSLAVPEWENAFIQISKNEDLQEVRNICTEEHVDIHIPQIQPKKKTELVKCGLQPQEKEISLRNDHGMDVLTEFSKRLVRCPYIVGIINSLPFNSRERKFIRRIRDDGLLEIVLPWTDRGYGIVVKTTGRNIEETERIAEIIKDEYEGI